MGGEGEGERNCSGAGSELDGNTSFRLTLGGLWGSDGETNDVYRKEGGRKDEDML